MRAQGGASGWPFALRETPAHSALASAEHLWAKVSPRPRTAGARSLLGAERVCRETARKEACTASADGAAAAPRCEDPGRRNGQERLAGTRGAGPRSVLQRFLNAKRLQWLTRGRDVGCLVTSISVLSSLGRRSKLLRSELRTKAARDSDG